MVDLYSIVGGLWYYFLFPLFIAVCIQGDPMGSFYLGSDTCLSVYHRTVFHELERLKMVLLPNGVILLQL